MCEISVIHGQRSPLRERQDSMRKFGDYVVCNGERLLFSSTVSLEYVMFPGGTHLGKGLATLERGLIWKFSTGKLDKADKVDNS